MSLFKRKKSLFMGTLLLVGAFGVWGMTTSVVLASSEPVESPIVEEVVKEESAPAEEVSEAEEEPAQPEEKQEESVSTETKENPVEESTEISTEEPTEEAPTEDKSEEPEELPTEGEEISGNGGNGQENASSTNDIIEEIPEENTGSEIGSDAGTGNSEDTGSEKEIKVSDLAPKLGGQIAISEEFGEDTKANNNNPSNPDTGSEKEFTTGGSSDETKSDEDHFMTGSGSSCTTNCSPDDEEVVSEEKHFNTLSDNTNPGISVEKHFTTTGGGCTSNCGPDDSVSVEKSFTTSGGGGCTTNCGPDGVSDEKSFTTSGGGGCTINCGPDGVSDEHFFTTSGGGGCTTNCGPDDVSDEHEFTTTGGGGGCTDNCGGGGGGGGGGRPKPKPDPELPWSCPILLTKFIRLGENNDPNEVRKLEAFLIVFEGFTNLKVNGIYEYEDFLAVSEFQKRYGTDVLGPWGIADSTGYVYITTTYAINNIYCNRSTANDLDLIFFYGQGGVIERIESVDDSGATTTIYQREASNDFVQLAAVGMFDFLRDWWCLLDILLLLIILALMAYGWWQESRERARLDKELNLDYENLAAAAAAGAVPFAVISGDLDEEETPAVTENKEDETIYL